MPLPLSITKRWLQRLLTAPFIVFYFLVPAPAQELAASVNISQATAASFCNRLRKAVRANEAARVSKWVSLFPIELQRDGKDMLILDDTDFQAKFDLVSVLSG